MQYSEILGQKRFNQIIDEAKVLNKPDDEIKQIIADEAQKSYYKQGLDRESQSTKNTPDTSKLGMGDTIAEKIVRGASEATARGISAANWVDDSLLGNSFISDDFSQKNAKILDTLEQKREKDSRKGLSGERLTALRKLDLELAKADGFYENAKAGLKKMADTVLHPTEWTLQGTIANLMPTDPANLVSAVTGGVGGKVITKLGGGLTSKVGFGIADGVVSGGVVEYGVAKGSHKSDEEANKAFMAGATVGALTNVPIATASTILASHRADIDPNNTTNFNDTMKKKNNYQAINDELKDNTLMKQKQEESIKDIQEIANIEQTSMDEHNSLKEQYKIAIENGGTLQDLTALRDGVTPTPDEIGISKLINDNLETSPHLAGFRIVGVLEDTIKNSTKDPQMIYEQLTKENFLNKDLANAFTQSYKEKTTQTLVDFISEKLDTKLDEKYTKMDTELSNKIDNYNLSLEADKTNWQNSIPKYELDNFVNEITKNEEIPQSQKDLLYALNEIGFVDELTHENIVNKTGLNGKGAYDRQDGKIHIDNEDNGSPFVGEFKTQTLIHEYIHSATTKLIENDYKFEGDIIAIMGDFKEQLAKNGKDALELYAMKDPYEFVSEAYSNPEVAKLLSETKISKKLRKELDIKESLISLWDYVIDRFFQSIYDTTGKRIDFDADSHMATLNDLMANKIQEFENIKTDRINNGESLKANIKEPKIVTPAKKYNPADDSFENMQLHPRFEELLSMREDVKASDIRSKNKLVQKGTLVKDNDKFGGEDKSFYVADTLEPNYLADFDLTKKDVENIRKGKVNSTILAKLQRDLATLDNDPKYKIDDEKYRFMSQDFKDQFVDENNILNKSQEPYANAPDSLMGFSKDKSKNKSFDESNYKHIETVKVTWDNGSSFIDEIKGLNKSHALERAKRNWDGAKIESYKEDNNKPKYLYKKDDTNLKETIQTDQKEISSKWEKTVDKWIDKTYYKGLFGGAEKIVDSVKLKDGVKLIVPKAEKTNWLSITEQQNKINESINEYKIAKHNIYDQANRIKESLKGLSETDNKELLKALNGDIEVSSLSKELQDTYSIFRDTIDDNANELVKLGILKEDEKIKDYVKRYYQKYVEESKDFQKSMAFEQLKKRKDLTYDERVELGMVEDAGFTIANTIAEQNTLMQKAKILKKLADEFGLDQHDIDTKHNGIIPDGYVKMSNEQVKDGVYKWGALAGKYIPKELKKELGNARIIEQEFRFFEDGLYSVIDHIKVNVTVKNPVTHLYNIGSNLMLSFLNGDIKDLSKVLYMRATNPKKFKELVATANKYGLNSFIDDVEDTTAVLYPNKKKASIVLTIFKNLYASKNSKIGDGARKLYDWEDKIFKLASFKRYMDEGFDEKKAFKKASEVYVDYSTPLPSALKFLDKSGLMPFLHYQYKATPAVAKVILKNPIKSLILGTGIASIGGLRFQDEEDKNLKPDWANDKLLSMFYMKEWTRIGNGYYFNSGRIVPGTKLDFDFGGFVDGALNVLNGKTPLGYTYTSKYDNTYEKVLKGVLVGMENYLPPVTFGRYGQRLTNIGLGNAGVIDAPINRVTGEEDTVKEVVQRAVGMRKFNEPKEARRILSDAKKRKVYEDKNGANPKETQKVVDQVEKEVKKSIAKFKLDINQDKKPKKSKDLFDIKLDLKF